MSATSTYTRFEFVRLFRNRQNFIFSLVFPLVMFYAIAGSNRHAVVINNITVPRYYMAGMIAFGTLAAVVSGGARIAIERDLGWNRQLRLTPLSAQAYLRTKVVTAYLMAIISLVLVTLAALSLGVRLPGTQWLEIAGLVLVALIPFAALGVLLGHLIKGDSMGPVMGGGISLFSLVGGAYFPVGGGTGFMHDLVRLIPSFWLVQAGKIGVGGQGWTSEAWLVIVGWSVILSVGAAWAYRRDTARA